MTDDKSPAEHGFSNQQREELRKSLLDLVGKDEENRQLAEANFQLVLETAPKYTGRGLELLDLAKAGNAGLVVAIEKFKPDRGVDFPTYAGQWIKQQILRSLSDHQR